jgi:1-acyl-sn-glycerol-3-phosphate acyltransferase
MKFLTTLLHRLTFALRVWAVFLLVTVPAAMLVIAMPGRENRRRAARRASRVVFRLAGIRVRTIGMERLPDGACFLASTHATYLDGPLLTGALPPRFGFVIKREALRTPIFGWLLVRLGSVFVERFNTKGATYDATRLIQLARDGVSLGVFPEGTFRTEPGLRAFHLGAFMAATRAGIPVVPVVIRGARQILPGETLWPRPGSVEIEILPPIQPAGKHGDDARALRDQVRAAILARVSDVERLHAQPQHSAPHSGDEAARSA